MASVPAPLGASSSSNEVKHLAERLNAAQVKIKRLNRLEAALVDFFMEVMDRSIDTNASGGSASELGDSAFARQKRKEQFLRKADGDPISLLNALRTHLRLQFAAQNEQQASLSSSLSTVVSRKDIQEKDAADEIRRIEAVCEAFKQRIDVLMAQVSNSERVRTRLDRQYKCCLEEMSGELHQLRAQDQSHQQRYHQQQLEVETLKQSCETLLKEKKKLLDDPHSATSANNNPASAAHGSASLTASVQNTGSSLDLVSSTPAETQSLRRALRDHELKLSKLEALNDESKRETQRLQQQLSGYKHNAQAQAFEKLDKEFRRTRAQADEAKKKLAESDADLLRTKAALRERDSKIQQMKSEYNKLFHALQRVKTPAQGGSSSSVNLSSSSPGKLARLTSVSSLGSNIANNGSTRLKAVASTPSLLTTSRGSVVANVDPPTSNNATATTMSSVEALTRQQANDNPYLLEHYKARLEALEKEIEGFKVQIRKMIASEYRYKQKNRLFRLEKSQLVDTCDRLRLELDKAVLSSARTITNVQRQQQQLAPSYSFNSSRSDGSLLSSSAQQLTATGLPFSQRQSNGTGNTATVGGGSAVSEVKKLRQRNLFLEERFRAIIASAGAAKDQKTSSGTDDPKGRRQSVMLRPQSAAAAISLKAQKFTPEELLGGDFDGGYCSASDSNEDDEVACDNQFAANSTDRRQMRRQSSIMAIRQAPESSEPSQPKSVVPVDTSSDSFKSLDTDTLQALQQVKTKVRVRPQSAQAPPSFRDGDVDPGQHERVAKALEQVNGLKYRYYAQPKEAKKVLNFHSDDSDSEGENHSHTHVRRASKAHGGGGQHDDDDDNYNEDGEDADAGLSFDDHIDRILRKTRTIALLKIANNTAEILPEDDLDDSIADDEDAFDFDGNELNDNGNDDDVDSTETEDRFNNDDGHALRTASSASLRDQKSFRHGKSMRSTTNSVHNTCSKTSSGSGRGSGGGSRRDHDEALAAMRLVRTLSSFLSLPRVISYKDLEMITETLLNEPSGGHDDYGDLIDFHVDSARDSSSAGGDGGTAAADDSPIWKRRNTNTIQPLTLPDDPGDLELHQRRMFMEANRFNRFSSKNFFSVSSKSMMTSRTSMRLLGSPTSLSGSSRNNSGSPSDATLTKKKSKYDGSFRSTTGFVAEELDDEKRVDDAGSNADENLESDLRAEPFDEEEYIKWRTEVKAEYLAWLQAKLEAKRKRRETLKKEAGKKPRWLLLYEASKRPEPKEPKK